MYGDIFKRNYFISAQKLKNACLRISKDNTMLLKLLKQHNKDVESLLGVNEAKATLQKCLYKAFRFYET
jgi:hypothetical protein